MVLICLSKLSSIFLFGVITAITFFASVKKFRYRDNSGVAFAEKELYITYFTPDIINQKKINIRTKKSKCGSAPRSWSYVNKTVALTILTFQHLQYLHLISAEVAWVLVFSGTQVQPEIIPDPDYVPGHLSVSYDYARSMVLPL